MSPVDVLACLLCGAAWVALGLIFLIIVDRIRRKEP